MLSSIVGEEESSEKALRSERAVKWFHLRRNGGDGRAL